MALISLFFAALFVTSPIELPGRGGAQQARDWAKLDACRLVPGDAVARALGGKLVDSRSASDKSFSRCTYFVVVAPGEKRLGYVVYLQPAEDFETLKKYIDDPISTVAGLGDAAYMFHDKGDGRYKVHVLKRGDLMFVATGESADSAQKVAKGVVGVLWARGH